jgi:uncharacterized membrane protein YcfT
MTPTPPSRVAWIDTVKGTAILLVVLLHVATATVDQSWYDPLVLDAMSPLRTVRMPLFFAMAGYFFLRRIDRPWRWQVQNRLGPLLWLFILWSALWSLSAQVFPWNHLDYTLTHLVGVPGDPTYGPWFIYALAIYYAVVKLLRPLPLWVQFGIGAAVSLPVAVDWVTVGNFAWERTLTHLVVFQFGVYGHRVIAAVADRASWWTALAAGGAWAAGIAGVTVTGIGLASVFWLPLTALGMTTGVILATLAARHLPWLHLDWFGRNTLPVYLLHLPVLGVLLTYDPGFAPSPPTAVTGTVFLTVLTVAGALVVWRVLRPVPGLFTAPWRGEGTNTRPARDFRQVSPTFTQHVKKVS